MKRIWANFQYIYIYFLLIELQQTPGNNYCICNISGLSIKQDRSNRKPFSESAMSFTFTLIYINIYIHIDKFSNTVLCYHSDSD